MVATVSARSVEPGHEYYHLNPALLSTTRLLPRILTSTAPPGSSCASSSSCSSSPATTHTSADSWHPKPESPEPEPQAKHEEPQVPRRKKASRACGHCQKAHLTCDDGRPCKRCEKRGLATSCADGARKKAKYLSDYDDSLLARPPSAKRPGGEHTEDVCKKVKLEPDEQEYPLSITWGDVDLLDQLNIGQWRGAEENAFGGGPGEAAAVSEEWAFGQHESGLEEWLEAFEGTGSRASSADLRCIGTNPSKVPNEVTLTSESQQRMEDWTERIVRSIEIKKLSMNITADDEWMLKRNLDRSLLELERLMELSGTPTMVWSALGEILRVGDEFCMLSDWSREELIGRHIEEVFESESLEQYMNLVERSLFADEDEEIYPATHRVKHVKGIPEGSMNLTSSESQSAATGISELGTTRMMKWCRIRKSRGQQSIGCSFCFKICRDTFNCPSFAVGNFLPILT